MAEDHTKQYKQLDDFFRWHVYIGGAKADNTLLDKLARALNGQGISTCLKYNEEDKDVIMSDKMTEGINRSQRCLLYITANYLTDDYRTMETQQMIARTKRFSKDMLVLLVENTLPDDVLPAMGLDGYTWMKFSDQMIDEKFVSSLADTFVQEPNAELTVLPKDNIGYGSALGYFYGFLRLVLPDFKKRLYTNTLDMNSDPVMCENSVSKMMVILPQSCFCPARIDSDGLIEEANRHVNMGADRAGDKRRNYNKSLYKIFDRERPGIPYFFVGEFATPLLTMFETHDFQLAGFTRDQLYMERDAFCFALKAILNHPDNLDCNNTFRLLYWEDPPAKCGNTSKYVNMEYNSDDGSRLLKDEYLKSFHEFLLPYVKEEVVITQLDIANGTLLKSQTGACSIRGAIIDTNTNSLRCYPMDKPVRGRCLIINIVNFSTVTHTTRHGSNVDADNLKEVFEQLRFQVETETDVSAQKLEQVLLTMQHVDHSDYDAFACCILSHGKLGVAYTSDGKEKEIIRITEFFTDANCPTLRGKPKLFFIQACQEDAYPVDSSQKPQVPPVPEYSNKTQPSQYRSWLIPGHPDFLMSYSTLPGSVSYRHKVDGSPYIQALKEHLKPNSGVDICHSLTQVTEHVQKKLGNKALNSVQLPFHLTTGMNKLIFL